MTDKIEKLMVPLRWLKENTSFLETVALVNSQEGLIIASTSKSETEEQDIAAISATVYTNSQKMVSYLKKNELRQILLQTEDGYIVVCIINETILLTILAKTEASLGLIFLNTKKVLKKIYEIIMME